MKQGQLFSQPFTIIFTLVVAALIIFFGYKAITGLLDFGEKVCIKTFQKDLQSAVRDIAEQPPGSTTKTNIPTCSNMKAVCIATPNTLNNLNTLEYSDVRETLEALSATSFRDNVFIASTKTNIHFDPFEIKKLRPTELLCDDTLDGRLNLLLASKGTHAEATLRQ
ncbi:MAG TPA: hypothetical protein VFE88_04225 [Candidatus Nanoarchaeia archaeon]|nr:hypothetical protein [Candidatus Nanoarchaeia archaeon]